MTDTTSFLSNAQGVSDSALFNLKPSCVRSTIYRASTPASNRQTWGPGDNVIFSINAGRNNTYLDPTGSYIKFTVKNNDVSGVYFDNNAYSVINQINIFHSGNQLENMQEVGMMAAYIFDSQLNPAQRVGLSSSFGMSSDILNPRQGQYIAPGASATVCVPFLSGSVGVLSDKLIPTNRFRDDVRCELQLSTKETGLVYLNPTPASAVAWSITSFEYIGSMIQVSDEGEAIIESVSPKNQPLFLHGNTWGHTVATANIPANQTGQVSTLISFRYASLKSIVCIPRISTQTNDPASYCLSSRICPAISSYQFRVGGVCIPSKAVYLNSSLVSNFSEGFM